MTKRKIEQKIIRGVIAKLVSFSLVVARGIILVPIILSNWGEAKYGVWLTLYSFFNLMLAVDLGHGQYISNEINQSYHVSLEKTRVLLGSALRVTFISALIQLLVLFGLYSVGFLDNFVEYEGLDAKGLFLCLALLFIYRLFFGGFKGILVKINNPVGYIDRAFYIGLFEQIIEVIVLTYAAFTDMAIIDLVLLFIVSKACYVIITFILLKMWYPEFFPWWQYGSIRTGLRNYRNSLTLSFNGFLQRFSNDGLNILVSGILSSKVVPLFATTKTMSNFAFQLSGFILQPLQPELSRFYAKGELEKVKTSIQLNWLFAGLVICVPFLIISAGIEDFYVLWTAAKLEFQPLLYALLVVAILFFNYGNSYVTYLASINKINELFQITFVRGVMICVLSFIFLHAFGLIGVGIALVATELVTSLFIPSYFVRKELEKHKVKISGRERLLAIAPVAVTALFHVLYFITETSSLLILIAAVISVLWFSYLQWKQIDAEVRDRILKIIPLINMN